MNSSSETPLVPEDLKAQYILRRKQEIPSLMSALASADFESIAMIGHRMKGNGISFGFPEISELGEKLENAARAANSRDVQDLTHHLVSWVGLQSIPKSF